ncbi:hypothetical protein O7626_03425 [Micromonospora sp. WMMD1102]|uniref:hypothetical protein n=1 Tax=Micromonospora sp. WMMD1102 TaxID=3016105 RepID=UPI0024152A5C|nr:hypothetical protein [Micromonospora sp. WMMD1102]MDG4784991.1 hypothetical protein [Micromonospora sp. WMMD1102]
MIGVDTSVWLLADLAHCARRRHQLLPYPAGRARRFYHCPCGHLYDADLLEALAVGTAASYDRRIATTRPLVTYRTWQQANRAGLRQHLLRLIHEITVVPTPTPILAPRWRNPRPSAAPIEPTNQTPTPHRRPVCRTTPRRRRPR